jgi:hypothetical protein
VSSLDSASLRGAAAGPGTDTRQWVSYGLVDQDEPNARSVRFTDENGAALPYPIVHVTLQPSGLPVACRVGSWVAGSGEGSWSPIGPGDEVCVLIPGGDEREGCLIVCRMNQGRDTFPTSVGGVDPTTNTTGFLRQIAPYIVESGTAVMLRVASNGTFLSLDQTGNATLANSDNAYLALTHDFVGLQTGDASCMVQLNVSNKQVYLQGGSTSLLLDDGGKSALLTSGSLSLVTAGGGYALGHAVTLEQVVNLLNGFLIAASAAATTPAALVAYFASFATPATLAALIEAAASTPLTGLTAAITAALGSGSPDPTGSQPGVGRPGLLL